jgi:hypothetical protein
MTGAFDGASHGALVFGTSAGLPPRADFAVIGNITPEYIDLFVINNGIFIRAKLAFARAGIKAPWSAA